MELQHKYLEETFLPLTMIIHKHYKEQIFPLLKQVFKKIMWFKKKASPMKALLSFLIVIIIHRFNITAALPNDVSTVGPFP